MELASLALVGGVVATAAWTSLLLGSVGLKEGLFSLLGPPVEG
jgi:hypothetical protein